MIDLNHDEAILFRILTGFFGKERVILRMSVLAVCGGKLPDADYSAMFEHNLVEIEEWSAANRCLFTIVDDSDNPRMVIEFFSGYEDSVDIMQVEHQTYLPCLLKAAGVQYITISDSEFSELVNPQASLDFFSLLKAKVNEQAAN